jgi:hypothetical protein
LAVAHQETLESFESWNSIVSLEPILIAEASNVACRLGCVTDCVRHPWGPGHISHSHESRCSATAPLRTSCSKVMLKFTTLSRWVELVRCSLVRCSLDRCSLDR